MKTIIIVLACAASAAAQTFSINFIDTVLFATPTIADVVAPALITNTTSHAINVFAVRRANVADTTWQTAICMTVCMSPFTDTAGSYGIPAGSTQLFLLHFTPTALPGNGDVHMEFRDLADTPHAVQQWFHLTTGSPQRFTSPASGSNVFFGEEDTLRWTTTMSGTGSLSLSTDGGDYWNVVASDVDLTSGMYLWAPPPSFVNTGKLRLGGPSGSVLSDLLKVTARFFGPGAGAVLSAGQPDTVTWTPGVAGTAEFDCSINGAAWIKVAANVSMYDGQYVWAPRDTINSNNVRVRLKTATWSFTSDPFTVRPSSIVGERLPEHFDVTLVPNPTHDIAVLNWTVADFRQVSLFDALGRKVAGVHFPSAASSWTLDLAGLPAGSYRALLEGQHSFVTLPVCVIR